MTDDYNNDDNDGIEEMAPAPGSDYEIAFSHHSDTQLERAYDKAYHWVKVGVRPTNMYLENRAMSVINFRKVMKDPLLLEAGVERMVDFRCSLTLTDTDVDVVFSSVCYYEQGGTPTYVNAYDPEYSSIKEVLNIVSNNLFAYLQKPLMRREPAPE